MADERRETTVKGVGASSGRTTGYARISLRPEEALEEFEGEDIIVTGMTGPGWTICMRKAKAIVTNTGGILSHAAIVAREIGIPCVVGTEDAVEKLEDGSKILVDGTEGEVYQIG